MDKLIYSNSLSPNPGVVEQLLDNTRDRLIEGLAGLHLGGRPLPAATERVLISDLLAAALSNTDATTITEKDFKVVEGYQIRLVILGEGRDATVLGRRVYSPKGELVGERLRSPASSRRFGNRQKNGGDVNAPAANRFVASWASPQVRRMTRRLGLAERRWDLTHAAAQWAGHLEGHRQGSVPVGSFCLAPEMLADPIAEAPRRAKALAEAIPNLGYRALQAVAKSLDIPAGGKAEDIKARVAAKAVLWGNVPKAAEAHADALAQAVEACGAE